MNVDEINVKDETKKIVSKLQLILHGKDKFILPLVFIGFIGICFYFWYIYLYRPGWSEVKRQEYIQNKGQEAVFNEQKYNEIVSIIEKRQVEFKTIQRNVQDIFRLKR